ncbi:unnamed protein product [Victoria cruziana]
MFPTLSFDGGDEPIKRG